MSNKSEGARLEQLCIDHPEAGEALRAQLGGGEQLEIYVVGKDNQILALAPRSLYIIKPGSLHVSGATVVGYAYDQVSQVAVRASHSNFAFEVQTIDMLAQRDLARSDDIDRNEPNIIRLEEHQLPAFEGALALVLERIANARL
jgi:hypothetical protein